MNEILKTSWFGNTVESYLLSIGLFFLAILGLSILKKVIFSRLNGWIERTHPKLNERFAKLCEETVLPILTVGAFYFSVKQLTLNDATEKLVTAIGVIVLTIQLTRLGVAILIYAIEKNWLKQEDSGENPISRSLLSVTRVVVWGMAAVFILGNLGFNVSAVVAGLGIGGVAVALAAQTILGDLFNYFVISFDRPFEEGDTIVFDDSTGVIEHIGIKSTRIRALGGEQIIVSNSNLASSKIRNYKRMQQRRVVFKIGIAYETPIEKVRKIPAAIQEIIERLPGTRFDRAHFQEFGAYTLNFEIVYYVLNSDMTQYLDIQQGINLKLMEVFARDGIEFAYPTQVQLQKSIN